MTDYVKPTVSLDPGERLPIPVQDVNGITTDWLSHDGVVIATKPLASGETALLVLVPGRPAYLTRQATDPFYLVVRFDPEHGMVAAHLSGRITSVLFAAEAFDAID
jgi:hypothetical protein